VKVAEYGGYMTRTRWVTALLIVGLVGFYHAGKNVHGQAQKEKAASFALKLLNGGELKSSDLKGKVTVIKFVASY
jgi:hypothetical protein